MWCDLKDKLLILRRKAADGKKRSKVSGVCNLLWTTKTVERYL
jgi:hypothetical protein